MGWNTTVIVLNDAIDMIRDDPNFGKNLYYAILNSVRGEQVDVPAYSYRPGELTPRGVHVNAATVIEQHHADDTAIVAIGQNYGTKIGSCYYTGRHDLPEGQEKILRQLADNMGYRLVKKSAKRK